MREAAGLEEQVQQCQGRLDLLEAQHHQVVAPAKVYDDAHKYLNRVKAAREQAQKTLDDSRQAVVAAEAGLDRRSLTRTLRALRGFRKVSPARSRLPIPEEVAAGIAAILMARQQQQMASLERKLLLRSSMHLVAAALVREARGRVQRARG